MVEDRDTFFQELIIEKLKGEFGQLESHLKSILNERKNNLTEMEIKKVKLAELLAQSREAIVERDEEIRKLKTVFLAS